MFTIAFNPDHTPGTAPKRLSATAAKRAARTVRQQPLPAPQTFTPAIVKIAAQLEHVQKSEPQVVTVIAIMMERIIEQVNAAITEDQQ